MVESSTITCEMIGDYTACGPQAEPVSLKGTWLRERSASRIEQLADLLSCVQNDVRACHIVRVFSHEALRRFCKPAFDLIHEGKTALPHALQIGFRQHQVRCACEEKGNPVRILCCGRRQSVFDILIVRQFVRHTCPNRIYLAYRNVADAVRRTRFQTAYSHSQPWVSNWYAQESNSNVQVLTVVPSLPTEYAALATGGARG